MADFIDKLINNLNKLGDGKFLDDEIQTGMNLAKDGKGARTNARIDAMFKGEEFDETNTDPVELETKDQDIVNELVDREINKLFGDRPNNRYSPMAFRDRGPPSQSRHE